jgi:hypothetical protein
VPPEHIQYVLQRVEDEIAKLRSDLPATLRLSEAELAAEQRLLATSSIALARAEAALLRRDDGRSERLARWGLAW